MHVQTSVALQEQFPEVYKDFFAKHDMVMSGHFGFNRFPVGVLPSKFLLNARSQLQLKCYIGIKRSQDNGCKVNDIHVYKPGKKYFETLQWDDIWKNIGNNEIDDLFSNEFKELLSGGYEINVLSEVGRGHGFGFTGTMISLIVTALYMHIDGQKSFSMEHRLQDIVRNTQEIHTKINPASVGQGFLTTLVVQKGIVFWEYPLNIAEIKYGIIDDALLPLDYIIFHSGKYEDSNKIQQIRSFHEHKIQSLTQYYKTISENTNISPIDILMEKDPLEVFHDNFALLSVRTVQLLQEMCQNPHEDKNVDEFICHLNAIKSLSEIIEGKSNFSERLENVLRDLHREESTYVILPLFTNKQGGDYLLVSNENLFREQIQSIVEGIRDFFTDTEIIESSWDQKKGFGVQCEQRVSNNSFSEYVEKDMFLYVDTTGRKIVDSYTALRDIKTADLLMDLTKNKIFHGEKELTSEHLQSKTTTIEIFKCLLESKEYEIINTDLAPSSFTRQQNQMLGKIVIPLKKYCSNVIGKELGFECHGSLREFHLTIEDAPCVVGLILPLSQWRG